MSNELRRDIVKLVIAAGNSRPISLLLGLSEKVILGWKDMFALEMPVIEKPAEDEDVFAPGESTSQYDYNKKEEKDLDN